MGERGSGGGEKERRESGGVGEREKRKSFISRERRGSGEEGGRRSKPCACACSCSPSPSSPSLLPCSCVGGGEGGTFCCTNCCTCYPSFSPLSLSSPHWGMGEREDVDGLFLVVCVRMCVCLVIY